MLINRIVLNIFKIIKLTISPYPTIGVGYGEMVNLFFEEIIIIKK